MTRRHFWIDAYCRQLDTRVARVVGDRLWLEESIFYAESGGQESDTGTIGGCQVLRATLENGDLEYLLPEAHGLVAGQPVRIEIDWPRRYALMRLHFAAEVVLEVACGRFGLTEKIGAHIGPAKARIDFAHDVPLTPMLAALTASAQQIVDGDFPIVSDWEDRASDRRFWHVEGFARVPCGGTHLRRTSEIGHITLARKNIGRARSASRSRSTPRRRRPPDGRSAGTRVVGRDAPGAVC